MYTILITDTEEEVRKTLKTLQGQHNQTREAAPSAFFRISTAKGIYNIPHKEILFIESAQKKSIIHTHNGSLILPVPLYRMREALPASDFIQTHRSFLINLKNVSFIDKTKEPWTICFFSSPKTAFVSRSYRKEMLLAVGPLLHCLPQKADD